MTADRLRAAARLIRERAEAATPGPWHSLGQWLAHDVEGCTCGTGTLTTGHEGGCGIEQIGTLNAPDAKHAAGMHPAVALAVADMLDGIATRHIEGVERGVAICNGCGIPVDDALPCPEMYAALAVAAAYLTTTDSRPIPGA